MLYVLIGIGILFVLIGFILNQNNAKVMLSGYNTMSEDDQRKFNLESYIPFFKKFHLILGTSFIVLGTLLHEFVGGMATGIFLAVYPILAYIYFMFKSSKYSSGKMNKSNKLGAIVLIITLIGVVILFGYGSRSNNIYLNDNSISIDGMYGLEIPFDQIEMITIAEKLPEIKTKSNGFAAGNVLKGYFKTKDGRKVIIFTKEPDNVFLHIKLVNGKEIYYNSKELSVTEFLSDYNNTIK